MSYEVPSIYGPVVRLIPPTCKDCLRGRHCVWDGQGQADGCACTCPNMRHYLRVDHQGALCGVKWRRDASYFDTNMWMNVTCPDCLALR